MAYDVSGIFSARAAPEAGTPDTVSVMICDVVRTSSSCVASTTIDERIGAASPQHIEEAEAAAAEANFYLSSVLPALRDPTEQPRGTPTIRWPWHMSDKRSLKKLPSSSSSSLSSSSLLLLLTTYKRILTKTSDFAEPRLPQAGWSTERILSSCKVKRNSLKRYSVVDRSCSIVPERRRRVKKPRL